MHAFVISLEVGRDTTISYFKKKLYIYIFRQAYKATLKCYPRDKHNN